MAKRRHPHARWFARRAPRGTATDRDDARVQLHRPARPPHGLHSASSHSRRRATAN